MMKGTKIAKNLAQSTLEPLETLKSQVFKPIGEEALAELGFFGGRKRISKNPQELGKEDLQRARDKQKLEEMEGKDNKISNESAQQLSAAIQSEYKTHQTNINKEQQQLKEEVVELQSEIVKLAKTAGIDTKAHLENMPKKVGILDIRRLTTIVRFLKIKAEESKSAKELVYQRSNAKRTTGMLAWVSGKQMKVYEQGTLQLQG